MPKKTVLIADRLGPEIAAGIRARRPDLDLSLKVSAPEHLRPEDFEACEAFIGFRPDRCSPLPDLPWYHCSGAGVDGFLRQGDWPRERLLTRSTGRLGQRMGEYCLAWLLNDSQNIEAYLEDQRERRWQPREPGVLQGQRVSIIGCGSIGRGIAEVLRAFGLRVFGLSRSGARKPEFEDCSPLSEAAAQLSTCDALIVAAPATDETRRLVNAELLSHARRCPTLINVARGQLLDETALIQSLDSGRLKRALLDVFTEEPLKQDSPLWRHPKVRVSPHVSGRTLASEVVEAFLDVLDDREAGRTPRHRVDTDRGY